MELLGLHLMAASIAFLFYQLLWALLFPGLYRVLEIKIESPSIVDLGVVTHLPHAVIDSLVGFDGRNFLLFDITRNRC